MSAPPRLLPAAELMPVVAAALARGQHVRLTVTGGSMTPFLRPGDEVELAPLSGRPAVGQVVLVRSGAQRYTLHRVARVEARRLWTRGDALAHGEGPFDARQVLGRVVTARRGRRSWSLDQRSTRVLSWLWRVCQPWSSRWLWLLGGWWGERRSRRA